MRSIWLWPLPLALVLSCGAPPEELETVPHPELGSLGETVRTRFEEGRRSLESLLETESGTGSELVRGMGSLGRLYHAYGLYRPAAACYRNAEVLTRREFSWPYLQGLLHQSTGELDLARQKLERALSLRSQDAATRLRLGAVLLDLNDLGAAEQAVEPILGRRGFEAAAYALLGKVRVAQGDSSAALEHFESALRLQPEATVLHYSLAMAHRALGDPQTSERYLGLVGRGETWFPDPVWEEVLDLATSSGALLSRGNRALANGRAEEAVQIYRQAVAAQPDSVEALRALALALLEIEDLDAAITELERARVLQPKNVWVPFDLGNVHLKSGDFNQALRGFRRALKLAPDFESARFNLANTLIRMQRFAEARIELGALLERNPRHTRARYQMAMMAEQLGDRAQAVAALLELTAEEPRNLPARQGLASILMQSGDLEGAVEELYEAVKLAPSEGELHLRLAQGLEQLARYSEAAAAYATVVELEPETPQVRLRETLAWVQAGDYSTARRRLEEGIAASSGGHLRNALARLLATCPHEEVRDGEQALRLAQALYSEAPSLDHAETLAMALAEAGRFGDAARTQRALIEKVQDMPNRSHLERLQKNLTLYHSGRPVRMQ